MKSILNVSLSLLLLSFSSQASSEFFQDDEILEANDAGRVIIMDEELNDELQAAEYLQHLAGFLDYKRSFQSVAQYITPKMERGFDVFIIVNVDHESRFNKSHEVPSQRMKILRKTRSNQKVFNRDSVGRVVSLRRDVIGNNGTAAFRTFGNLTKISSGAKHFSRPSDIYDDTPTGIYRINDFLSSRQRYSYTESDKVNQVPNPTPVMYDSLFIDLKYPTGKVSGVAVHGTNKSQYKFLGKQRSHGCVRIKQEQSKVLYENLIVSRKFWGRSPKMDKTKRLKSQSSGSVRGPKALYIIFYGYDLSRESWDI